MIIRITVISTISNNYIIYFTAQICAWCFQCKCTICFVLDHNFLNNCVYYTVYIAPNTVAGGCECLRMRNRPSHSAKLIKFLYEGGARWGEFARRPSQIGWGQSTAKTKRRGHRDHESLLSLVWCRTDTNLIQCLDDAVMYRKSSITQLKYRV